MQVEYLCQRCSSWAVYVGERDSDRGFNPFAAQAGIGRTQRSGKDQSKELKLYRPAKPYPKKPRGRVWPGLTSVGGDIQPQQVTVLTPATQRR